MGVYVAGELKAKEKEEEREIYKLNEPPRSSAPSSIAAQPYRPWWEGGAAKDRSVIFEERKGKERKEPKKRKGIRT
jgi:hypothetical protein